MLRLDLRFLAILLLSPLITGAAEPQKAAGSAAGQDPNRARIGNWGIDLSGADRATRAGNDFYKHANGLWASSNTIPADRTAWGTAWILDSEADRDVRAIIESFYGRGRAEGRRVRPR